ncbi:tryptophan--tRNA ligase [Phaeodactylibacter luteus]|uniref:Tryptophan--tRNA ligase n=1 Tax=Phaeodactylibacter luteus TaxID=1564516 RepID=A0A5C6RGX1_9BACT|nr:tryptophan--tRNA ligase [Phaeodactylibacter luteus]TXB61698.1 tryptophan--tRNA ligase [Phaeodactylibacter luteus]
MEKRKQVLSAIQPTGQMHFGNYFGAVQNWVKLQENYDCIYGVVDYHAMTMPYQPKKLRENTWELLFNLMAVGVKPEYLFIQSLVPEHAELCWILNCFTSYGQLTRMTQFKDKSAQVQETATDSFISAGLLDYPVLQAADILIYRADYVPVGKDQEQHLELTRNIAQRFNNQVGKEYFVLPEPLYTEVPKVRSTAEPNRKMSKSAGDKHYIDVFAEDNRIRKQIRSAVTDTGETPEGEMSPGVANLFEMLKAAGQQDSYEQLMKDYEAGGLRYVDLKDAVADGLVALSQQFRENKKAILADKKEYKNKIKASSAEIRKKAQETVREVKELAGLSNVRF